MQVVLSQPRGFCAGVVRAVEIVELALEIYGPPIYVFHEIVHNRHVVETLQAQGAIFVENLAEVPSGSVTVFSAHGVSTAVVNQARQNGLDVIDATCPLVTKVHLQAQRYSKRGYEIIIVGHPGHEEIEGTMGRIHGPVSLVSTVRAVELLHVRDPDRLAYVTQTTLSIGDTRDVIDALKKRFPNIQGPELNDICYATQNRQNAVSELAAEVGLILVVGAVNSSNSNRLREVSRQCGVDAYLIRDDTELDDTWFAGIRKVGITAGASTPEILVQRVLQKLHGYGVTEIREMQGVRETTTFRLPKSLLSRRNPPEASTQT